MFVSKAQKEENLISYKVIVKEITYDDVINK